MSAHQPIRASSGTLGQAAYPLCVGLAAGGVFICTLAPTVTAEDSGELIAAAWHFGIPHPPGYPLWTLLCGLFIHAVPVGPIAYRANLFSAICSTAAAVVAYAAVREAGASKPAAAAAALIWILSHWSWSQSVIAEVYALNSLLTAGLMACVLRWRRTGSEKWLCIASLLVGLGMSNHHIIALAALAACAWVLGRQPGLVKRGQLALKCILLFLVGLIPYIYVPWRAATHPAINWGDASTLGRFWQHVTRHQYGAVGPTRVAEPRSFARFGPQLAYLGRAVADDLTPWLTGLAAAGLCVMARRDRSLLALVLLWMACTGVLFVVLANYDLDRTSRWAMRVFLIPVSLGLALPIASVLDWMLAWIRRQVSRARFAIATALLIAAGPVVQVVSHWRRCDYSRYWYALDHGENLLRCMLPNAMVFPSGDHNAFPLTYVVMVEKRRPDVLVADVYGYVSPELYQDRPNDSPDDPEAWLIKKARRPVYYTTKKSPPVGLAGFVTAGMLYHLLPEGMSFDGRGLMEKCTYRNLSEPTVRDFGAGHILTDYAFFAGLHALEAGTTSEALSRFQEAQTYGTGIKEVFNNIGSALGEHGLDEQAIEYFQQAAELDWRYALPRWNLFRLLKADARWQDARALLQEILRATPDDFRVHGELGFILMHQFNDPVGAVRAWRESLRLNPNQPQVLQAVGQIQSATSVPTR